MQSKSYKYIIYKHKGGKPHDFFDNININGHVLANNDYDKFKINNYASTYGEITRHGFKKMLEGIDTKNKIFYDLGSGVGKSVVWAVTDHGLYGNGIELSKARHDLALQLLNQIRQIKPEFVQKMNYINDDIFNRNIGNANIIFISNLCFPEDVNQKLAIKLSNELKPGTLIFCSKELQNPKIRLIGTKNIDMTWSKDSNIHHYIIV